MPSTVSAAVRAWIHHVGPGLLGVACSGGADSLALADATIQAAGGTHVVVIAIDHGLQAGSDAQAAAVATWARGQGAAAIVERVACGRSEASARAARYAALARIADAVGIHKIFLGHTARDQAETVLLRVVRGTGVAGLAGIPAERDRFARPLLALPRVAIDAHVAARGLVPWHDPLNADRHYARVRVREDLLPRLRAENPQVDAALVRLAAHARELAAALDQLAPHPPFDCRALARLPAAVRKHAYARLGSFTAAHLAALDRLVLAPTAGTVALDLPRLRAVRTYDTLTFAPSPPPRHEPVDVHDPVPDARTTLTARTYRPGDRMKPARLRGRSRKLSDLYIDAKVPRALRASARVLLRGDTIVWAEHIGLAFGEPDDLVPR